MKCPVCNDTNLATTEYQGIEIDSCPECRGICLDRGELDKPIERAERQVADRSRREYPGRVCEAERRYRHDEYRHKRKIFPARIVRLERKTPHVA